MYYKHIVIYVINMRFCSICNNLLVPKFVDEQLVFSCQSCYIEYKSTDEDSLRWERVKEKNIMIYEKILNKAADDPATLKAYVNCINAKKNCSSKIVKQVRIGDDMRLYNVCVECHFIWLSN
jgi:DNA-directed RNA polymerase subunit M/transcription elongation factor TFIIS